MGWLNEYVGCKVDVDRENRKLKITQPVLLQSFNDEFDLPEDDYKIPAESKSTLRHSEDSECLDDKKTNQISVRSRKTHSPYAMVKT